MTSSTSHNLDIAPSIRGSDVSSNNLDIFPSIRGRDDYIVNNILDIVNSELLIVSNNLKSIYDKEVSLKEKN